MREFHAKGVNFTRFSRGEFAKKADFSGFFELALSMLLNQRRVLGEAVNGLQ
jgi:hypothetical protein